MENELLAVLATSVVVEILLFVGWSQRCGGKSLCFATGEQC